MRGCARAGLIGLTLAQSIVAAQAWVPETRIRMIDEAVRLMPASLRIALERQREALLRGMLEPMVAEDSPDHQPAWADGRLEATMEREARALIQSLGRSGSFAEVARLFGGLAHYVVDLGFAPLAGGAPDEPRYAHFAAFCESRRERFPLVFYGHEDRDLLAGDYAAFALRLLEQAREDDRMLARAYAAAGDPPDPSAFDDRSVPFAIASLSYSRSITNVVRAWLSAWESAGGDLGRTPYREPAAAPTSAGEP